MLRDTTARRLRQLRAVACCVLSCSIMGAPWGPDVTRLTRCTDPSSLPTHAVPLRISISALRRKQPPSVDVA